MANSELSATALEELSSQIQSNSKTLINHLQHEDQLQSSVEDDARVGADVQKLDSVTEIHRLQNLLKQDALKLFRLASGPSEYIAHIALNHQYTICLRYLCHFKVFAAIPTKGSISLSNVSIITSAPLAQLTSVIRLAATNGLFTILPSDRIEHSPTSLLLATSPEFNAWATFVSQHMFDASSKLALSNELWGRSEDMKHSAFSMAFNTELAFPEYLASNPSMARTMGQFLSATQQVDANSPRHLVNSYDWKSLGEATVIDVNTTTAIPAIALAEIFPLLSFELQTQERALKGVETSIQSLTPELASRFTTTTYSAPAPPSSKANNNKQKRIYLLRHFLHNLPDPIASKVLSSVMALLESGDKLLIQDLVIPKVNELDPYAEGMLRMREMIQLLLANGRTRTEEMWGRLVGGSRVGAVVKCVTRVEGSDLSLLEIDV